MQDFTSEAVWYAAAWAFIIMCVWLATRKRSESGKVLSVRVHEERVQPFGIDLNESTLSTSAIFTIATDPEVEEADVLYALSRAGIEVAWIMESPSQANPV